MSNRHLNWYARVACLGAVAPILISCASHTGTDPGEEVRASQSALALPKPEAISCQGDKRDTVRIAWRDAATDETNYRVERQIGAGAWSEIKVADPNSTLFDDLGADVSQQNRHYRVRSFRASDNTFSPYSDVCNNRRIFDTAHFRIFYGLRGTTDECPQIDTKDVCLLDRNDAGTNVFVKRISDSLEGSLAAFDRVGFRAGSAGTPPAGNDKIPINVVWCDGGGCANGGGLGLAPEVLERNFDLVTRVGDPASWIVGLHEAFHFQQFQYSGINDPDWNWLVEGQARSIQDKLCIGANRAACNNFDDITGGAYGYVPELQAYMSNTKQSMVHASYQSVLFWTYLTEKYGTSSPADTVEGGMNFLTKFWEATSTSPGNDGITGINNALTALGSLKRFRDVWKDFAVATYAKDLSGPGVQAKYKYADMAQPGGAYGTIPGISSDVLNPGTQVVKTGINLLPWSAHYYELKPAAGVPVIDLKVLQDSTVPVYYTVLGIKGTDVTFEFNLEGRSLDKTLVNNAFDKVVVVVAGLENSANYRASFNGTLPTLAIRTPLSSSPVRVGDPAAPDKFRVAVELLGANGTPLAGVDRSLFSFKVGTNVVPVAGVINSATVQGQQWFIVQAPAQATAASYDLQVNYGALTATATQAVSYSPVTTSDSVVTIDRSGSMSFNNKLVSAQDAARLYVDSWHPGDKLGVVSFNDLVTTNLALTDWTNTAPDGGSRQLAFNAINGFTAAGNTAIGDAVRQSWNSLTTGGNPAHDWAVVLLSDGLSNAGTETFQTVIAALKASTVKKPVIHAIALGPDADQALMQQAASDTGGTYQFVSAPADTALRSLALSVPSEMGLDLDERYRVVASKVAHQQQVYTATGPISDNDPDKDVLTIPIESGASELVLSLSWPAGSVVPTLKDPSATTVAAFEIANTHYVWRIPTPTAGSWQLTVENRIDVPSIARVSSVTAGEGESLPPYLVHAALRSSLLMDTYLPTAIAERIPGVPMPILVSLTGAGPIAGASVTAGITSPSGSVSSLTLLDDGRHGDGAANDGLYGNTFLKTSEPGSYGLTIGATGTSAITGAFARQDLSSFFLNGGGDSDGDHLPNTWETSHGTDPNVPDGTADDDNDGADNETEWHNGTDPKNPDTDNGGESDGTDPNPLDPSDDGLLPTSVTAYPGAGKVYVRYLARPTYTRTTLLRSTNVNGPYTVVFSAFPGNGLYTDSTVINGTNYCYRVNGFDASGRRSAPQTPSCATPKADPIAPHGSVAINKGQRVAVTTNVTLTLWASDAFDPESSVPGDLVPRPPSNSASGVKEMLIGNRPDLTDGVWQPYATSKPWVLAAASGPKTVYVKYRDNAGNESPVTSATINLVPLTTSVCTASPLGVANGFNIFSLGNVSQSATDTQGRVAVGGNATFVNYSVGSGLSNSNGARDDLIVDSRLSYNNGTVYNGNITYGGTAALSAVNLAHGTSRQAHPLSFPAEQVKLELESTAWGTLPANGTTTVQYFGGPTAQITLTGTNATLNVFTISAADFSAANSLTIKAPSGSTVLVNIPGATPQMKNFGTSFVGTDKQHVLYNFFEANTLTVSGIAVRGSILAPYAAISFVSGSIDGTLIGSSLSGGGESHLFLFQGCAPVPQMQ